MKKLILASVILFSLQAGAQVGIGTAMPVASAQLEVKATNKGFLPPRIILLGTNDITTIATPEEGLVIYNTATAGTSPNNVVPGLYVFSGGLWVALKKDDLGNHTATQNLKMNGKWISNDGDNEGIYAKADGTVGIGTATPAYLLDVNGTMKLATAPEITNGTFVLARDPATKQISEQEVTTKASGLLKASTGDFITLDNIRVRVTSSGLRSLEIASVAGTIVISGTSLHSYTSSSSGSGGAASMLSAYSRQSASFNTTFVRWHSGANFPDHGNTQLINILDETNNRAYRISLVVSAGYTKDLVTIERLL